MMQTINTDETPAASWAIVHPSLLNNTHMSFTFDFLKKYPLECKEIDSAKIKEYMIEQARLNDLEEDITLTVIVYRK
jgi:hypothetical protein